jgi:hypothetical protein
VPDMDGDGGEALDSDGVPAECGTTWPRWAPWQACGWAGGLERRVGAGQCGQKKNPAEDLRGTSRLHSVVQRIRLGCELRVLGCDRPKNRRGCCGP